MISEFSFPLATWSRSASLEHFTAISDFFGLFPAVSDFEFRVAEISSEFFDDADEGQVSIPFPRPK